MHVSCSASNATFFKVVLITFTCKSYINNFPALRTFFWNANSFYHDAIFYCRVGKIAEIPSRVAFCSAIMSGKVPIFPTSPYCKIIFKGASRQAMLAANL